MKWPRKKSMDKLKDTIRNKTRRTDGQSLRSDLGNLFYAVENNSSNTTTVNGMCCYVSCNVLVGPDFGISAQARSH
jgi:hypothetical protein